MSEPFIGIDFGTTTSVVAWLNPGTGQADILLNEEGQQKTPSVVYFGHGTTPEDSGDLVGELAEGMLDDLEERRRVVASVKRDLVSGPTIALPGRPVKRVKPVEVATTIFRKLKHDAEELHFHQPVSRAVVTYPASFDELQQAAIEQAAEAAGLTTVILLAEPIAAALAYAHAGYEVGDRVLVYDLGGGTFDLALLLREGDSFRQGLPPRGLARCGGDDFDYSLYDYLDEQVSEELGQGIGREGRIDVHVLRQCRRVKERLTSIGEVSFSTIVTLDGKLHTFQRKIDRATFEGLIEERVRSTVRLTETMLDDAARQGEPVDTLVLVGGSSQLPLVRRMLAKVLPPNLAGDGPERWHQRDLAVALGAAYHGTVQWKAVTTSTIERGSDLATENGTQNQTDPRIQDQTSEVVEEERQDERSIELSDDRSVVQTPEPPAIVALERTFTVECQVGGLAYYRRFDARCALSPDGKLLAVTSYGEITIWDVGSGAEVCHITAERSAGGCSALSFTPDSRYLVAGYWSGAIWSFDAQSGQRRATLKPGSALHVSDSALISALCIAPSQEFFAAEVRGRIYRGTLTGTRPTRFSPTTVPTALESIALTADGKLLAGVSATGEIDVWNVDTGTRREAYGGGYGYRTLAFSPDGRTLATDGSFVREPRKSLTDASPYRPFTPLVRSQPHPAVILYDTATGGRRQALTTDSAQIAALAFSRDGRILATGVLDAPAQLWDLASGGCLQRLSDQEGSALLVAFLPDGHSLVTVHSQSKEGASVRLSVATWHLLV